MASFIRSFNYWVKTRSKGVTVRFKYRPIISVTTALFLVLVSIIVTKSIVSALSKDFVQTDWSGGADTITTINDTNLSGWTKYYSKTDGVNTGTAGEVKLNITITQP
jgi:hypothetical protein